MIKAHPAEEVLADYALGVMAHAPGLVVGAHLRACPQCRRRLGVMESVAGALLMAAPPATLSPNALGATYERILASAGSQAPARRRRTLPEAQALPNADIAPRRWFGPGRWVARVRSEDTDWKVFLIRAPAGARLPQHGHSGPEFTCILQGAFHDGRIYRKGDFVSAAPAAHSQHVTADGPCICLIACHGPLKWRGVAALMGRFLGI